MPAKAAAAVQQALMRFPFQFALLTPWPTVQCHLLFCIVQEPDSVPIRFSSQRK
jgi:hypothetical protein